MRKREHSNASLQADFDQYGEEAFVFIVLEYTERGVIVMREKTYIISDLTCYNFEYNPLYVRVLPVFLFDIQGTLIKEFSGICEASKELRVKESTIYSSIKRGGLVRNRYRFSYTLNLSPYVEKRGLNPNSHPSEPRVMIGAYKDGKLVKRFRGFKDAARHVKGRPSRISTACSGKVNKGNGRIRYTHLYKGYEWTHLGRI